jgi:hypothetical protein
VARESDELLARVADTLDGIDRRHRDDDGIDRRRAEFERALSRTHDPRRLDLGMMCRAVPGLAAQIVENSKPVPGEFWQLDGDEAIIACPCKLDACVAAQELQTCECGRMFAFDGDQVRAIPASFFAEQPAEQPRS